MARQIEILAEAYRTQNKEVSYKLEPVGYLRVVPSPCFKVRLHANKTHFHKSDFALSPIL